MDESSNRQRAAADGDLASLADNESLFAGSAREKLELLRQELALLAKQYDVVVANPPYMGGNNMGRWLNAWAKRSYKETCRDLCTCFIYRGFSLAAHMGLVSMITMESWMFLNSFERMRRRIIADKAIVTMAHLGTRAFDSIGGAVVATSATVFTNGISHTQGWYFRLVSRVSASEKNQALLKAVSTRQSSLAYRRELHSFSKIPGNSIAYWASNAVFLLFNNDTISSRYDTCFGLLTGHDDEFIRSWHEVSISDIDLGASSVSDFAKRGHKYAPIQKGGDYRKWYGNHFLVVRYDEQGLMEMAKWPKYASNGKAHYFEEGLSWGHASEVVNFRFMPKGFIFMLKGPALFTATQHELLQVLGYLNGSIVSHLIPMLNPTISCGSREVKSMPYPSDRTPSSAAETLVKESITISRFDWDSNEISWDFKRSPLL